MVLTQYVDHILFAFRNSQNSFFGAYTCLVVNFDEKDGQPRPAHIPKTEVRQTYDAITGWEEQLIPASFHFLVKDGENQHVINDPEPAAPRSMLGIKADGTIVSTIVNTSMTEAAEVDCQIADFQVKGIVAEVLSGDAHDHNSFEKKDTVKTVEFTDFEVKADGFKATIPPCAVVKFVIR